MQNKKPPETTQHSGRATSPQNWEAKKSCYGETLINECSIFDRPSKFESLQLAPHTTPPQTAPFPQSHTPLPTKKPKPKSKETETAPPFPWETQGQHTGPPHMPGTPATSPHKPTPTPAGQLKHPKSHQRKQSKCTQPFGS